MFNEIDFPEGSGSKQSVNPISAKNNLALPYDIISRLSEPETYPVLCMIK